MVFEDAKFRLNVQEFTGLDEYWTINMIINILKMGFK